MSTESMDYFLLLTDELIHSHIISKLSAIDVARTSFLSRRWRSFWDSLSYLDFDQFQFHDIFTFTKFVDRTIRKHAGPKSAILRFKLILNHGIDVYDLDNWVRLVMSKNVREFYLHFSRTTPAPYQWPSKIDFMANTLTLLELYDVKFDSTDGTISLPHLQTLYFENVCINQETFDKFINGCPSMTDLQVWSCHDLYYILSANHPQLKSISIGNCNWFGKLFIFDEPSLESLTLYLTQNFVTLSYMGFALDEGVFNTLKEFHLSNFLMEDAAFHYVMAALTNLESLTLESVKQCSQHIEISIKNLKKLVLNDCEFLVLTLIAPNLTSLKYENNYMWLSPLDTCNVKFYIFSNCCNYSTGLNFKSLKFEPVKEFLMNSSNDLWEDTKMIIDLHWCKYTIVLEDWESIAKLPNEVIDKLFPKAMCISNMSFPDMAEWLLDHGLCFSEKLLIISSTDDSELHKILKDKRPDYYNDLSSFTMNKEAFETNTGFSVDSINNINRENDDKIAFLNALFEVGFNTREVGVLENL